ncbi:MAG: Fur family transcriptional regulator [bacterium]
MPRVEVKDKLEEKGIISTAQRRLIVETLLEADGHLDAENLFFLVREKDPTIGLATVYRTLKLLKEKGLIQEHRFGDGHRFYESNVGTKSHYHFECIGCGRIVKFESCEVDDLIDGIADANDFSVEEKHLKLVGYCGDCRRLNLSSF